MMPTFTEVPPISDPIVTVKKRALVVVYDFLAQFKLSEWGINPAQAMVLVNPTSDDPRRVFYAFSLFAAMVAHNYGPGEVVPTASDWVRMLGDDADLLNNLMAAVGQALGKRLLASMKKTAEAQPATEIPAPSSSGIN